MRFEPTLSQAACSSVFFGLARRRCCEIQIEGSLMLLQEALAQNVSLEQGKTVADAHGDVFRGLGMEQVQLRVHARMIIE